MVALSSLIMRLKFRRQSTPFTCKETAQAIALNYLMGTDYSDIDIIANRDRGYLICKGTFDSAMDMVKGAIQHDSSIEGPLIWGTLNFMQRTARLPSLREAIAAYRDYAIEQRRYDEKKFRDEPYSTHVGGEVIGEKILLTPEEVEEKIINRTKMDEEQLTLLEKTENDEAVIKLYNSFTNTLDEELLKPVNYRFTVISKYPHGFETDFSGMIRLSGDILTVDEVERGTIATNDRKDYVFILGAKRCDLGLPQHLESASHAWVLDRIENGTLVLLDTNHHLYDHGPEVSLPLERLKAFDEDVRCVRRK
jgi:hypothetical protein